MAAICFSAQSNVDAKKVESTIRRADPEAGVTLVKQTGDHIIIVRLSEAALQHQAQERQLVLLSQDGLSLPFRPEYVHVLARYPGSSSGPAAGAGAAAGAGQGSVFSNGEAAMLTVEFLEAIPWQTGDASGSPASPATPSTPTTPTAMATTVTTLGQHLASTGGRIVPLHDKQQLARLRSAWLKGYTDVLASSSAMAGPGAGAQPESMTPLRRAARAMSTGARSVRAWAAGQQPLDDVRDYFGEDIAFYFAWEGRYTRWLAYPAALGLAAWLVQTMWLDTTGTEPGPGSGQDGTAKATGEGSGSAARLLLLMCLALALSSWSSLFTKNWKRRQTELAYGWCTLGQAATEKPRPEYKGTRTIRNPVTGALEPMEITSGQVRRFLLYTLPAMSAMVVLGTTALLLNEQMRHVLTQAIRLYGTQQSGGTADGRLTVDATNDTPGHSVADSLEDVLRFVGLLSTADGQRSWVEALVPLRPAQMAGLVMAVPVGLRPYLIYLHTVGVQIITRVLLTLGRAVAEWTTTRENHRLHSEHTASIVAKLVLISSIITYGPLLYIAFVEQDLTLLTQRLTFALAWGAIINACVETGLPLVSRAWTARKQMKAEEKDKAPQQPAEVQSVAQSPAAVQQSPVAMATPGSLSTNGSGLRKRRDSTTPGHMSPSSRYEASVAAAAAAATPEATPSVQQEASGSANRLARATAKVAGATAASVARAMTTAMPDVSSEVSLGSYDPYDDVSEMFTQYGYVVLFGPIFPLAPLLAWINNLQEGAADAVKICALARPVPRKTAGLGAWTVAFDCLSYVGVLVNAGLIGLISAQADWPRGMSGGARVLAVLLLEHVVLALKLLLEAQIPDIPYVIHMRVLREAMLRPELIRKALRTSATAEDGPSHGAGRPSAQARWPQAQVTAQEQSNGNGDGARVGRPDRGRAGTGTCTGTDVGSGVEGGTPAWGTAGQAASAKRPSLLADGQVPAAGSGHGLPSGSGTPARLVTMATLDVTAAAGTAALAQARQEL